VLEVQDISIRFGGLQALAGISLQVNEFEIVGLIGPNGAGKTTAFNCITGFYQADTGRVLFRGRDVTAMPPHKKASIGFGRTFQNVGMVKSSTALENLKTAQYARTTYDTTLGLIGAGRARREEKVLAQRADAILDMLSLGDVRDTVVGSLPYGVLKLLEVGCALATDPQILLLDEPSSGMGPDEAHELGDRLLRLRRELGLTMLLIEHHVPLVTAVCDHVYVLNFGRLLAEGVPAYVKSHPEVVAAYLGGEAPEALAATQEPAMDAVLDHPETLSTQQIEAVDVQELGHSTPAPDDDEAVDDEAADDAPTVVPRRRVARPAPPRPVTVRKRATTARVTRVGSPTSTAAKVPRSRPRTPRATPEDDQ